MAKKVMDNIVEIAARFLAHPNKPRAEDRREAKKLAEKHGLLPDTPPKDA